jgi:hypothetical protein
MDQIGHRISQPCSEQQSGPSTPSQNPPSSPHPSTPPPSANSESPLIWKHTAPPSPAQSSIPSNNPPAAKVNRGEFPHSPTWPPSPAPKSSTREVPTSNTWPPSNGLSRDCYEPQSSFNDDPENDRRNNPSTAPWKFTGYRIFSRWMATDNAFLILRRFGNLNARIALSMQDDIVQLEEKLDAIEKILCSKDQDWRLNNGSFREDPISARRELIKKELPQKLAEYSQFHSLTANVMHMLTLADAFINGYSQLLSRPEIHQEDLASVRGWLKSNQDAIDKRERRFVEYEEDLIGIRPKSRSCFRKVLEYSFLLRMPGLRRFPKRTPREYDLIKENSEDKYNYTTWQDDRKVEGCSSTLVAVIGLGMLVGPLWILAEVSNPMHRLGIITGFIALFFVLVKVATRARIFDALAAAAAYSAVLMVFLQAIAI